MFPRSVLIRPCSKESIWPTPSPHQSIGNTHTIFVEKGRGPRLTGHKTCTQDPNEKSHGIKSLCTVSSASKSRRDDSKKQCGCHDLSWSPLVNQRPHKSSDGKGSGQCNNIRVVDLTIGERKVGHNGVWDERGECKPRQKCNEKSNCVFTQGDMCFDLVRFFKTKMRGDGLTPTEMEYSCIWVSEVKHRYGAAFQVNRVYDSRFPEMRPLERRSIQRPKVLNHS